MHQLLETKLTHLRDSLVTAYLESSDYPAPVQGVEREIFLHNLLMRIPVPGCQSHSTRLLFVGAYPSMGKVAGVLGLA